MVTMSGLRAEVEIWPFRACPMHPAVIIETVTVRSLWTSSSICVVLRRLNGRP